MLLKIVDKSDSRFHEAREKVKVAYGEKYSGWSTQFDSQFDSMALCFLILDNNKIVATSKLIFNDNFNAFVSPSQADQLIGFTLSDLFIYCEGTGLWYEDKKFLAPLWFAMFSWLDYHSDGTCLSLFDLKNKNVSNANIELLQFKPLHSAKVIFNDIVRNSDRTPVAWTLALQTRELRKKALSSFNCENLMTKKHLETLPPI